MVFRDIELSRLTGAPVHFLHLSTARSVDLVRAAKADGLLITAEAAPHHFTLTDESLSGFDPLFKVNPPLRENADIAAVKLGLADGTIDAIASDHQPRDADDKRLPFALATPGGAGLATLLGITLAQVHNNGLPMMRALALLTCQPARILGVAARLARGEVADLCLFEPERAWQVIAGALPGKAPNTPFDGRALEGQVIGTWKAGRRVFTWGSAPP